MDVTSVQFLAFSLVAAILYNLGRAVAWRQTVLLVANVAFLSTFAAGWKQCLPFIVFLAIGYAGVWLMQKGIGRSLFVPVIVMMVFLFVWLKQYTFLPPRILLPLPYLTIGLSYIFFRVVHMIVDAKDAVLPGTVGIVPYLNYTLNFTSLVAGPIQLYPDFAASQLAPSRPPFTLAQCAAGLERVAIGFFKLKVLAVFFSAAQHSAIVQFTGVRAAGIKIITASVIATAYTLYLYFNFSGYVDLVIGVARMFRLNLPENFNRPFSSTSFIEFWSRWHMTLSNWLKTYVYTPLVKALMSQFPSPHIEPLIGVAGFFVTFFLVGAWHGQTSEFLFFGVLQGGGVSLNKLYQIGMAKALGRKRSRALDANGIYRAFSRGLTFTYFTFTLIWFWSRWEQVRHLAAGLTLGQHLIVWLVIWFGSTTVLALWEQIRAFALSLQLNGVPVLLAPPVRAAWAAYLAVLTWIAVSIVTVSTTVMYQIF